VRLPGKTGVCTVLLVAAGLMTVGCGTAAHTTSTLRTTLKPPAKEAGRLAKPGGAPAKPRNDTGVPVGTTERVPADGTTLVVKVTKVIDPLVGSGAKVPAGMEPVGVVVSARNAGPGGYDSSATSDFGLLTAAGPVSPVYVPTGICQTYIQDFMNEVGPGQARNGCIAFAVPLGKAPTTVRFSADGGTVGHGVSWRIG